MGPSESEPRLGHLAILRIARQDQLVFTRGGNSGGNVGSPLVGPPPLGGGDRSVASHLQTASEVSTTGLIEDMFKRGVTSPSPLDVVFVGFFLGSVPTLFLGAGIGMGKKSMGTGSERGAWFGIGLVHVFCLTWVCVTPAVSAYPIGGVEIPFVDSGGLKPHPFMS